ncbi:MAG: adenylate/guanylate cyclase domain-containing protein [Leptospiraceae bacterium]|nr:adenylate/guanylate cyclase domain-containing protein [Leptospiraceae bacterium]
MKYISIILFLCLILSCSNKASQPPKAINGILDLRNWDFEKDGVIKLDGYWEFYWKELYDPDDFQKIPKANHPDNFIDLPYTWNNKKINGNNLPGQGYATFRLTVLLPKENLSLSLLSKEQSTAYKIFLNGDMENHSGVVAKEPEKAIPQTMSSIGFIKNISSRKLEIIMQISNYDHRNGGIWHSLLLGEREDILFLDTAQRSSEVFLSGMLLIMALYHIVIYLIRRKDKSPILFALVCMVVFFRLSTTGSKIIPYHFHWVSYYIYVAIEYISFFFSIVVTIHFLQSLFPEEFHRKAILFFYTIATLFSLFTLFTKPLLFSNTVPYYQIVFLLGLVYVTISLSKAIYRKRKFSKLIFGGIFFMMATSINDILYVNEVLRTGFLIHYGIAVLVFSQAVVLSLKFSNAFSLNEKLVESSNLFVPREFLNLLGKSDITQVQLGDKTQKEMTVFFSDIRKFTELSETMTPDENFKFINAYLKKMGPIIRKNNGFIDKYIGDAIMALYPDKPEDAINSAIEIQDKLNLLNQHRISNKYEPIIVGIGIHIGNLMLGTIGESERMDGTVISDAVNLASRLEGLTKIYGCSVIVSETTFLMMDNPDKFTYRILDTIRVKGKKEPVTIYQIVTKNEIEQYNDFSELKAVYEKALNYYRLKDFAKAISLCEDILEFAKHDKPSEVLLHKCRLLINRELEAEWEAITTLFEK